MSVRMNKLKCFQKLYFSLIPVGIFSTSCSDGQKQSAHVNTYANPESRWDSTHISVCWEKSAIPFPEEQRWVQEKITHEFNKTVVRFTGWGICEDDSKGIRIGIGDVNPYSHVGKFSDGVPNSMMLNFTFDNWAPWYKKKRKEYIEKIAVHEFGHAIGLEHEQARPDTDVIKYPNRQVDDAFALDDFDFCYETYGSPWDLDSEMNYNNPNCDGKLSDWDIYGINKLYSTPPPIPSGKNFTTSLVVGLQPSNFIMLGDVKLKGIPCITNGHPQVNPFTEPVIEGMYFDGNNTCMHIGVKNGIYGERASARFNISGEHAAKYSEFPVFSSPVVILQPKNRIVLPYKLSGFPIIQNGHWNANQFVEPVIESMSIEGGHTILNIGVKGGSYGGHARFYIAGNLAVRGEPIFESPVIYLQQKNRMIFPYKMAQVRVRNGHWQANPFEIKSYKSKIEGNQTIVDIEIDMEDRKAHLGGLARFYISGMKL